MSAKTKSRLLDFAFACWRNTEFVTCCLRLQNEFQVNITRLLFLLWLDNENLQLSGPALKKIIGALSQHDATMLLNLRQLRSQLSLSSLSSAHQAELKAALLAAELQLETRELELLEALALPLVKMASADANMLDQCRDSVCLSLQGIASVGDEVCNRLSESRETIKQELLQQIKCLAKLC